YTGSMSPARRFLGYLRPYLTRYLAGVACLVFATTFSLAIPWTVKRAVDALSAGTNGHTLAVLHGLARLGSRFAMIGAGQWVEHDVRRDLYASFLRRPPAFYHTHRTG